MSYAENPESNPYLAPLNPVAVVDSGRTAAVGYAGFWRRFAAMAIDNIILFIVLMVYSFGVGIVLGATGNQQMAQGPAILLISYLVIFGLFLAYYPTMESSSAQATLGKQAMGIKVTDLNGRRLSYGRALARFFGKALSTLIAYIGFIMAAFTERKQALHDLLAGTLVVSVR